MGREGLILRLEKEIKCNGVGDFCSTFFKTFNRVVLNEFTFLLAVKLVRFLRGHYIQFAL